MELVPEDFPCGLAMPPNQGLQQPADLSRLFLHGPAQRRRVLEQPRNEPLARFR